MLTKQHYLLEADTGAMQDLQMLRAQVPMGWLCLTCLPGETNKRKMKATVCVQVIKAWSDKVLQISEVQKLYADLHNRFTNSEQEVREQLKVSIMLL